MTDVNLSTKVLIRLSFHAVVFFERCIWQPRVSLSQSPTVSYPLLSSAWQHSSYGDCLEVKREYYQNCSVLSCVTQCSQSAASSSYRSSRSGLSHWAPYVMHRGGCLELYYCNMVEWCWSDSSFIWKTNRFPSVLWHCWFGHMTCKNRPRYDL